MKDIKLFTQYQNYLKKVPRKYWIIGGVLLSLILIYSLIFFIPKKVDFSYAGDSCARQLVLFPGVQTTASSDFTLSLKDELKIGSFTYATTTACVEPKSAPMAGDYTASVGLFGGWFMKKPFTIKVAEPPVANKASFGDKAISAALPLKIELTGADTIHTYELTSADKTSDCTTDQAEIVCNVSALSLKPGSDYTIALHRSFQGTAKTTVAEGAIQTLLPIVLTETDLTQDKVIYDTQKEFTFTFDKPVENAEVALEKKVGETVERVTATSRTEGSTVFVTASADLTRKTGFTLTLKQVVADNGSSLEAPIAINFSTSGGPKPASVSVGNTNVGQNAQIVVTLDQPLKEGVDITKVARVEGLSGSVKLRSPTELVYQINGGLCQSFDLIFDKGVPSGSNAEVSDAWKFTARTVCGYSSVIGYSVQGRPITAYYFGNGSQTILFTGGIHGEERSAQQTMQAWADYLMVNGYKIPADKRVVVVPNLNPDGIARNMRYNANNVNLGRNYPSANWQASIDTASGTLPTGGGTEPGSEPETKAIMALTAQLRPRLEISFHAQGSLVGANKVADSVSIGNIYASTVRYGTMYNNAEEVMGYSITGEYEEWMGEKFGIPAILIELPTRNGNYLNSQLNALMKMLSV